MFHLILTAVAYSFLEYPYIPAAIDYLLSKMDEEYYFDSHGGI